MKDIEELAEYLYEEHKRITGDNSGSLEFVVKCFDNTSFTSNDLSLFNSPKSPLLKRRVRSVELGFKLPEKGHVQIGIFHGTDYDSVEDKYSNQSFIELASEDTRWLNAVSGEIQVWYDGLADQNNIVLRNAKKIRWITFFIGMFLFGVVIDWFKFNNSEYTPYWEKVLKTSQAIPLLFVAALFGGAVSLLIINHQIEKTWNIWPMVEIQIGPDHLQKEKQKRNVTYQIWALILIPLILSIISSVITSVFL